MEVKRKPSITTTLILNEEETKWLHNYMQNAHVTIDKVNPKDEEMRKIFFDATTP